MPDQCLKEHPVPRPKGQPQLKLGQEPFTATCRRHRSAPVQLFNFTLEQVGGWLSPKAWIFEVRLGAHCELKSDIALSWLVRLIFDGQVKKYCGRIVAGTTC